MKMQTRSAVALTGTAVTAAFMTLAVPFISGEEGRTLISYLDPVGIPTICDGIIRYPDGQPVRIGQTKSKEDCDKYLAHELTKAMQVVDTSVLIPLSVYQRVGLTSFTYNVGSGAFKSSTLLKMINNGNFVTGCDQLRRWVLLKTPIGGADDMRDGKKDGMKDCRLTGLKKPCNGIVRRRERERAMCLKLEDDSFVNIVP